MYILTNVFQKRDRLIEYFICICNYTDIMHRKHPNYERNIWSEPGIVVKTSTQLSHRYTAILPPLKFTQRIPIFSASPKY